MEKPALPTGSKTEDRERRETPIERTDQVEGSTDHVYQVDA
jgi:hypothetical protein